MSSRRTVRRRGARASKRAAVQPVPDAAPRWRRSFSWRDAAIWLALVVSTLAIYQPAWTGTILWDDDHHLTAPELRGVDGLRRIWFEPGATQQYYPLVHSAFWLQHRLWGDATAGYHLVTIVLHGCNAFLVGLILRRLGVPGAWFAAALFAVHPVHVESVAWITELKNTLSGVFGLAWALVYLEFDRTRDKHRYAVAALLFVLALASKTVTAMLPVMLLVGFWWRRGSLSWRRDIVPLAPLVVLGAVAGLTTAWVERTFIGAQGEAYNFTVIERVLIAGRAIWFYLGKLLWPSPLIFIYPRWQIGQTVWWQYLYPLAAIGVLLAGWLLRARSRTPLAVALAFAAGLFPVLGFLNVYPFRFSFVADHFQYLASIPVIAVVAGLTTRAASRLAVPRPAALAAAAAVVVVLSAISFLESRKYANQTVLYEATLRENPSCWLAHVNLGKAIYETRGDLDKAVEHFRAAVAAEPGLHEGHFNLALAYHRMGRLEEAVASYEKAIQAEPRIADTYWNLCAALRALNRLVEAKAACEQALERAPGSAEAQHGLGATLHRMGRLEEALGPLGRAAQLAPDNVDAWYELGSVLQKLDRLDAAETAFRKALQLNPDFPEALANLGFVLNQQGKVDEAIRLYREALRVRPRYADASYYLGNALQSLGRLEEAVGQYQRALEVNPSDAAVHNNLGLALEAMGRFNEAAAHYREAIRLRPDLKQAHDNLQRVSRLRW